MQKPILPWTMILRAQSGSLKPPPAPPLASGIRSANGMAAMQKNFDETYAKEHPALGHAWGKYVDDDKPGCQQQTETAHCTREGCTATDTCRPAQPWFRRQPPAAQVYLL